MNREEENALPSGEPTSLRLLLDQIVGSPLHARIGTGNWEKLSRLTEGLPLTSGIILECRPAGAQVYVDLALRLTSGEGGAAVLTGRRLHSSVLAEPFAGHLATFGQAWQTTDTGLHAAVENVWLEYDLPPNGNVPACPSFFFDMNRDGQSGLSEQLSLARRALSNLGDQRSEDFYRQLHHYLSITPENVGLYYVGLMWPRKSQALRLCLADPRPEQILSYLQAVQWPGRLASVEEMLDYWTRYAERLVLHLDLDHQFLPQLGLEIFPEYTPEAWTDLFLRLLETDQVSQNVLEALGAWPEERPFPDGPSRDALSRAAGKSVELLIKRLNHIKLTLDADGKIKAKIYLYLAYY